MKSDPGLNPPLSLCYMTIVDGEERMDTRAALNVAESAIGAVKKGQCSKNICTISFLTVPSTLKKEHFQIIFLLSRPCKTIFLCKTLGPETLIFQYLF